MVNVRRIGWLVGILLVVGQAGGILARGTGDAGYRRVTGPCRFEFPRDHGTHPGYRTEWWYYTGSLKAEDGARFGFQLTFFRRQLRPSADRRQWPQPSSAWRTDQVYLAHAALTDVEGAQHYQAEDMSRGALGLAGAENRDNGVRVFVRDWETVIGPRFHQLTKTGDDFGFQLRLEPVKAPVAHGDRGYSRKGTDPARASCYYSFTRMEATGTIRVKDRRLKVTGLGWMDHEYSTAPLEPGIRGWSWFSLQLDNGAELMLFLLNLEAGGYHPASSGTLVADDGTITAVTSENFRVEALRHWTSPDSGAAYPLEWRIRLLEPSIDVKIKALVDNQEMITRQTTGVTYWEGRIDIEGRFDKQGVRGRGYMELTGTAQAMDNKL